MNTTRATLLAVTLTLTLALSWAPLGAQGTTGARLYATNQDDATVSVVDLATRTVVATVNLQSLGYPPNAKPHHTQVEPDGSAWYVSLIGAGKVLKFDRANRVVGSIDMEVPGLLALDPDADILYAARSMSAVNPPPRVVVIRRSDMKILDEVDVFFPRPHALVAAAGRVFAASLGVNQLASISRDGEVKVVDIPGPAGGFVQLAVSQDHRWLALTAQLSGHVIVFDISDPAAPRVAKDLALAAQPFEPVFSPDGRELWVTNLDANKVTVLSTATWEPLKVIEDTRFAQPHGIGVTPDGIWIWISNRAQQGGAHDHEGGKPTNHGTVMAICRATRTVVTVLPVGANGAGLSIPSGAPAGTACR